MTEGKKNQKQKVQVKTFAVPFALGEIKENVSIPANTSKRPSKEQIINKAFKLHSEGKLLEAVKYYQYCINQGFKDHIVFSNYGCLLKGLGKLQEAEIYTRKAVELNPNFARSHFNLGSILNDLGKLEEAEISTRKAVELNPTFTEAHSNLGSILNDLGKLQEAEIATRKAVELNPTFAEAHSNLGSILKGLGKLQEAEIYTRKAIELKPDYTDAHSNLGNILKGLGKLQEAEIYTRKAIKLNPNFARAHSNLGSILKDLGKLQEAEIYTRKAIKLKPNYAEAYNNLGNIFQDIGKLREAENSFTKAIEMKSDFDSAYINRACLYRDQGKLDKALTDSDSCNTQISRVLSLEILYELGRIDEIYERIEKTATFDNENIRLASFSSFIAEQEKKNTSNNFCQDPLSFLYFSNIKYHCKDYIDFASKLIKDLSEVETIWEPINKTTRNGFQTPTHLNIFSNSSKSISKLKSIISNELESYYSKFEKESCSYIQKWPKQKNIVGWHVILKKQGYQEAHIHPGGWLSGVIYLKVVPPLEKDEGAIEFSLNGQTYFNINSPKLTYLPELGDIVLFPSSLHHRTIPFSSDTDRIVISFDLIPD
ncbi:tetratricopeptide repeat protein [Prochlorococcus marinus]|uniref:tetratricopeptide repeat protein n=1 Tax=Prochlorococcus marinus TaxID=1219 RepID=UPI0022B543CF|nr:tetratricopeptide repeat protein [Prochlorococcus marinus]